MQSNLAFFQMCVVFGLLAWAAVFHRYVWPKLIVLPLADAARPLLYLNLFRYLGLSFLVNGVAAQNLPLEFAQRAAWGDFLSAVLAGAVLYLEKALIYPWALLLFNIIGFGDLLDAFYEGRIALHLDPGLFGATFFIPTFYVPLLMCAHIAIFVLLARRWRG